MNKEEIEKAKENLQRSINNILFSTLYSQEEADKDTQTLLNYIQQLENKVKGQECVIETQAHNEEVYEEYVKKLESKVKEYEEREQKVKDYLNKIIDEENKLWNSVKQADFNRERCELAEEILNLLEGEKE